MANPRYRITLLPFRRLASKKRPRWWHVALALAALAGVVTSGLSPFFPDPDLVRYGLFVQPVRMDDYAMQHCEKQGGVAERSYTRVNCYSEDRTLHWSMELGE